MIVTKHAIERYQERVNPICNAAARAVLVKITDPYTGIPGKFSIKFGKGNRLLIEDGVIVTVYPKPKGAWRGVFK
ncbi:MAG: hypothetical protein V4657_09085 [Pseudomonadota bacterium]